jgi:hypothetical protein
MYRDSQLGLCLDLAGPEGNYFALMGIGDDLAKQLNIQEEWKGAVEALKLMGAAYPAFVNLFEITFPVITLINKEEVLDAHSVSEDQTEDS